MSSANFSETTAELQHVAWIDCFCPRSAHSTSTWISGVEKRFGMLHEITLSWFRNNSGYLACLLRLSERHRNLHLQAFKIRQEKRYVLSSSSPSKLIPRKNMFTSADLFCSQSAYQPSYEMCLIDTGGLTGTQGWSTVHRQAPFSQPIIHN
jgi:hypothetical protein